MAYDNFFLMTFLSIAKYKFGLKVHRDSHILALWATIKIPLSFCNNKLILQLIFSHLKRFHKIFLSKNEKKK